MGQLWLKPAALIIIIMTTTLMRSIFDATHKILYEMLYVYKHRTTSILALVSAALMLN
jgi:hypothetical protein